MIMDGVTYEVLRHRLWMINDEQAKVASTVSGSPIVYETKDMSSALMRPNGDGLFVSSHTTRLASCLQAITKCVIAKHWENPGIGPGDAFVTNDPWVGAIHQNDIAMVAPVFWADTLIAWTGVVMHEIDVGGATPGGLSVGIDDVYGEGPLIPPVRILESGRLRKDIEALVVRNSRTAEMNSLDIRARIAACNRTERRLREIVERYGCETLLEVQDEIVERTQRVLSRRISALPDGAWSEEGFLDGDGVSDSLYRIHVVLEKSGSRLTFDFRGTDLQAQGGVNCTAVGLEGGIVGSILPMLCYDLPWSTGALLPLVNIISEPGTVNTAIHPAGVSHGSVAASRATSHVVLAVLSKMCAATNSGLTAQVEANWTAGWQGMTLSGTNGDGSRFAGITLDQPGGGGARTYSDGIDTGGNPNGPSFAVSNVESYEQIYPLLYLYRRQARDSGGAGFYRGGVGTELLVVPHKANGEIDVNVLAHGAKQPEARGLFGGYPSSVQVRLAFWGCDVMERFAEGDFPADPRSGRSDRTDVLAPKQALRLRAGDALLFVRSGGAGFGDPVERPPDRVARDVAAELCSNDVAYDVYGVVLDGDGRPDEEATEHRREQLRQIRLTGRPVRRKLANQSWSAPGSWSASIANAYVIAVDDNGGGTVGCKRCKAVLGEAGGDPKSGSLMRERSIAEVSPWNRYGDVEGVVIREYGCPGCGSLGNVEVRLRDDPVLFDMSIGSSKLA